MTMMDVESNATTSVEANNNGNSPDVVTSEKENKNSTSDRKNESNRRDDEGNSARDNKENNKGAEDDEDEEMEMEMDAEIDGGNNDKKKNEKATCVVSNVYNNKGGGKGGDGKTPSNAANHNVGGGGGGGDVFRRREFSFTIEPVQGEEIYIRYQSFANENEFRNSVVKRRPNKIDLGAVYRSAPNNRHTLQSGGAGKGGNANEPLQRELVFDIDLTDYDDVRYCGCSSASICSVCWKYMNMAVAVMDRTLREDFGYDHFVWFYSGRRGVHCWVCDEGARMLTDNERHAVVSYMDVPVANDKNRDADILTLPLHPSLQRSYEILEPMFVDYVLPGSDRNGHGLLASSERWTELLRTLPHAASSVRDVLLKEWDRRNNVTTPKQKWEQLKQCLEAFVRGAANKSGSNKSSKKLSNADRKQIESWTVSTVFKYGYPRLDVNVSKCRNHLLKSPFCVHPKTGMVCVPIPRDRHETFDPTSDVPTLQELQDEIDANGDADNNDGDGDDDRDGGGENHQDERPRSDVKKNRYSNRTSLKSYYDSFRKEFLSPMLSELRREQRHERDANDAVMGEF